MAQALLSSNPFNITIWQPLHAYSPGDGIQPTTVQNAGGSLPTNPDFETSLTGWSQPASVYTFDGAVSYNGVGGSAQVAASSGTGNVLTNTNQVAVTVGQVISATGVAGNGLQGITDNSFARLRLCWYDATHTQLAGAAGYTDGLAVAVASHTIPAVATWFQMGVSSSVPSGASFCALAIVTDNPSSHVYWVDAVFWDYQIPNTTPPTYFYCVNTTIETSGSYEPDWTNGGTNVGDVTDGGITWARGPQTLIYWSAWPLCLSSLSEPSWALQAGGFSADGQYTSGPDGQPQDSRFHWKCLTPQIQDVNCPNTKYVAAAASKIYSGDVDIVRFSATTNPLDWTTQGDAGFLPTGLQTYGANPVTGMGLYRSNLVIFNSEAFQMWQVDEDPANMSLLTALPIGCSYPKTIVPVNTDLFWLAAQGVRTMGISGASANAEAGDVGMPIDDLVLAGIAYCNANGTEPLATYVPSAGQYWIHFPGWTGAGYFYATPSGTSNVFVYTINRVGQVGAWSRYNFPFPSIDAFCHLGDTLYLRSGDDVLAVDSTTIYDYASDGYSSRQALFQGVIQWPWLDFGTPGVTKKLDGIDVTSRGNATTGNAELSVSIGFDQSQPTYFTTPFTIPADTVPGTMIPTPCLAPSFSVRLVLSSADQWKVHAVNVYLSDQRVTS